MHSGNVDWVAPLPEEKARDGVDNEWILCGETIIMDFGATHMFSTPAFCQNFQKNVLIGRRALLRYDISELVKNS